MSIAEQVYYSLLGCVVEEYRLPWVENAFVPGSICDENYARMLEAYERLCVRLEQPEEDEDVEMILHAMLDNQEELCLKMFEYGVQYAENKPRP